MVNAGSPELIEIWNLVFIQYDRDATGKLTTLPAKHVDTGMGFERMCAVLQNKDSNYDTDVFTSLISRIAELSGETYDGRMSSTVDRQFNVDTAMRVIADHVRTLTFAIGDGALPSNDGRGYVLRRLLRRAARFGRTLGLHEPFIFRLVSTLVETMGGVFPEIVKKQAQIEKILKGEEEGFNATLDRGLEIFEEVAARTVAGHSRMVSGDDVFKLYDTYGFPADLTALIATERNLTIDEAGFQILMERQRERSRASEGREIKAEGSSPSVYIPEKEVLQSFAKDVSNGNLRFVGYDELEAEATLVKGDRHLLVLDVTPFYGEAGGQVGDQGTIEVDRLALRVHDTQKVGSLSVHILEQPMPAILGEHVKARVDVQRRHAIMRNHTATHLVHAALRSILGTHVHQAGSLVAPDYLRFDFAHFAKVTEEELAAIEDLVNEKIKEDIALIHHRNIPFEEAKNMGALMFFGDKYGDRVNVVEFTEFSREFCGGTHVKSTAEIGYFKFRSEGSVASGVRRIEAVTADHAVELLKLQDRTISERIEYISDQLNQVEVLRMELAGKGGTSEYGSLEEIGVRLGTIRRATASTALESHGLRASFNERVHRLLAIESIALELLERKKILERELSRFRVTSLSTGIDDLIEKAEAIDGLRLVSSKVDVNSLDELKALGDTLRSKLGTGVGLLAAIFDDKVSFVCVVTDDLVAGKRIEAGRDLLPTLKNR